MTVAIAGSARHFPGFNAPGVGFEDPFAMLQACHERVLRGGSWNDRPRYLRAAYRVKDYASGRQIFRGFRVARSL